MEPNEHAEPVEIASVGDCASSASARNRSVFGVLHCLKHGNAIYATRQHPWCALDRLAVSLYDFVACSFFCLRRRFSPPSSGKGSP